jgi:predicted phage tail protein
MLRNVYLYGVLGKKFGKKHTLNVESIGETINAFKANYGQEFIIYIKDKYYSVHRGEDLKTAETFDKKEQLSMSFDKGDFHLVPRIEGAKSGWLTVFIGAVLITAGVYFEQPWLVQAGIGMMLGGVAMLLTPIPTVENYEEMAEKKSFIYNGPTNSMEQGRPIPIVYGRCIIGSTVIAGEYDVEAV